MRVMNKLRQGLVAAWMARPFSIWPLGYWWRWFWVDVVTRPFRCIECWGVALVFRRCLCGVRLCRSCCNMTSRDRHRLADVVAY
jgi:hypothetical protein